MRHICNNSSFGTLLLKRSLFFKAAKMKNADIVDFFVKSGENRRNLREFFAGFIGSDEDSLKQQCDAWIRPFDRRWNRTPSMNKSTIIHRPWLESSFGVSITNNDLGKFEVINVPGFEYFMLLFSKINMIPNTDRFHYQFCYVHFHIVTCLLFFFLLIQKVKRSKSILISGRFNTTC